MRWLLMVFVVVPLVSCGPGSTQTTQSRIASGVAHNLTTDPGCTNNDCPPDPGCTNNDCPGDPGCTNNDCPPDPGCTNNDCPPPYEAGCCCVNLPEQDPQVPLPNERVCCCKSDNKVNCRLSQTIIPNVEHDTLAEATFYMGQVPSEGHGTCAPPWYPEGEKNGGWWPAGEDCGWMKQVNKCGPLSP